nr:MAG TPA: hypothetical protein [Caudoviricetes sp.]
MTLPYISGIIKTVKRDTGKNKENKFWRIQK